MDVVFAQFQPFQERLHGSPAIAVPPLIGALGVVGIHEGIQIGLDLFQRNIDVLAECHFVELVQDGLVEPLGASVGLRVPRLGAAMVDTVEVHEELVRVVFLHPAIFRAPVGKGTQ